jgi:imidazolonepropionase
LNIVLNNIGQLATCPPEASQQDAGLIQQAALVVEGQQISWVGPQSRLPQVYNDLETFDCKSQLVIPGLVDCHTHLCFGGWRGDEFAMRIGGASYQEIAAAGGGIRSTVSATRAASKDELISKAKGVLDQALALGVTTMECKSGYGLDVNNELKQLEVYSALNQSHAIELVATFLGAHIIPSEYTHRREEYVSLLCNELMPEIVSRGLARYCDVFLETSAYSEKEARTILSTARDLGLGLKVHADQLSSGGGAELAAEMGAISAEHLEYISDRGIAAMAASRTIAVSLPIASLYLGQGYLPARRLIEAGVEVAVATDFNPGSSPSFHLPLAMTLACINQKMTPAESLRGATAIAARAVGLEGKAGSLTVGSNADIAMMDAPDLNHWLYHFQPNACTAVMKSGRWETSSF